MWRGKAHCTGKEDYAATQGNWKWNCEFYKKEELEENSIYSFKPVDQKIWNREASNKKKSSIGVSESKILIDATIRSFKALGYEAMNNPDEKVNIEACIPRCKKALFSGEGLLTYAWIITKIYHPM